MIQTAKLRLVPLELHHYPEVFQLWSRYEVIRFTYSTLLQTPEECRERLAGWLPQYSAPDGANKFAIFRENEFIGIIGFPMFRREELTCGFFYQIVPEFWGNGYASEAAAGMLAFLLERHPNVTVIADAVEANPASIRILQKLGFVQTMREEKGFKNNGMELDILHFRLERKKTT